MGNGTRRDLCFILYGSDRIRCEAVWTKCFWHISDSSCKQLVDIVDTCYYEYRHDRLRCAAVETCEWVTSASVCLEAQVRNEAEDLPVSRTVREGPQIWNP